jgi:hypothetical protein
MLLLLLTRLHSRPLTTVNIDELGCTTFDNKTCSEART